MPLEAMAMVLADRSGAGAASAVFAASSRSNTLRG
jgi:hypothetical protein